MNTPLSIGQRVKIPAHRLSGAITTWYGEAPDRRISVELPDGTIMNVAECDLALVDTALPPEPAAATAPIPSEDFDLVTFARVLAQRTQHVASEEGRSLNRLARAYLVCQGRRL